MKRVVLIIIAAVMICAAAGACRWAADRENHSIREIRAGKRKVLVDVVKKDGKTIARELPEEKPMAGPRLTVEKRGITDRPVPAEHIPDTAVYETAEVVFNGYTEYRHRFSPEQDGRPEDDRLERGVNGDAADHFAWLFFKSPFRFGMRFGPKESKTLSDGFALESYDIDDAAKVYARRRRLPADHDCRPSLEVLRDGKKAVWASSRERFVNVRRFGDRLVVITDRAVHYVGAEKNGVVADVFEKSFTPYKLYGCIKSAKMLTDNVVRIEYKTADYSALGAKYGKTAHYKIRLTREDCKKNRKTGKPDASLIWLSGDAGGASDKAWDFDPDISAEPSYG
ncbi:MAG: hypothetical protein ILO36_04180 [Abditibacteriota bacterium]|nr:hypothetical protein [Abditibacteriota bacterium]